MWLKCTVLPGTSLELIYKTFQYMEPMNLRAPLDESYYNNQGTTLTLMEPTETDERIYATMNQ